MKQQTVNTEVLEKIKAYKRKTGTNVVVYQSIKGNFRLIDGVISDGCHTIIIDKDSVKVCVPL